MGGWRLNVVQPQLSWAGASLGFATSHPGPRFQTKPSLERSASCVVRLLTCCGWAFAIVCAVVCPLTVQAEEDSAPLLRLSSCDTVLQLVVPLPPGQEPAPDAAWQLKEVGAADASPLSVQLVPSAAADGSLGAPHGALTARIPPREGSDPQRRFALVRRDSSASQEPDIDAGFQFELQGETSIKLSQANDPVFTYNQGPITGEAVPANDHRRVRGCYLHPLWGLQGEQLTADFPRDHFHHHGLFWAWTHVTVGDQTFDLWEYRDIEPRFVRWLCRETGPQSAVLAVENGWFVGQRKVMIERVWLRVYRAEADSRSIDVQLTLIPTDQPVSLRGAEGKSYGGLTLRFDVWPRRDAVIRTPQLTLRHVGQGLLSEQDLSNTPLAWADLSSQFPGATGRSGAALLVHPQHPDYPPTWLTRCYGPLCIGWPGTESQTLQPGTPVTLNYRIWIHRTEAEHSLLQRVYDGYLAGCAASWEVTQ